MEDSNPIKNFLQETKDFMASGGLHSKHIAFLGLHDGTTSCPWEEFAILADCNYDSGYGVLRIRSDLIIIFKDGRKMIRRTYHGMEWWAFECSIRPPVCHRRLTRVFLDDEHGVLETWT